VGLAPRSPRWQPRALDKVLNTSAFYANFVEVVSVGSTAQSSTPRRIRIRGDAILRGIAGRRRQGMPPGVYWPLRLYSSGRPSN